LNYWMKRSFAAWALLAVFVSVWATPLCADTTAQQKASPTSRQKSQAVSKNPAHKTSASSSQLSSARRPAKHRPPSKAALVAAARRRRSMMRPESERIGEIQQALVKSGYLSAEPSGRWDDQTREAMRRYQADNGFPVTGLPEAKSLMKLGLGPHPLPPELDSTHSANAGAGAGSTPSDPAPATPDVQPNPPSPTTAQF